MVFLKISPKKGHFCLKWVHFRDFRPKWDIFGIFAKKGHFLQKWAIFGFFLPKMGVFGQEGVFSKF